MKSNGKRYLTGIDWTINALDYISKKKTGHGNTSQIIVFLKNHLSEASLQQLLNRVFERYPVLTGKVARAWNLCPYWKIKKIGTHSNEVPLKVEKEVNGDPSAVIDLCRKWINEGFSGPCEHLRFYLLHTTDNRSCLAMHFDHRLFDANGAEGFLELLARTGAGKEKDAVRQIKLTRPASLGDWKRRFQGGRKVNRRQVQLSRDGIAALTPVSRHASGDSRFHCLCFDSRETRRIIDTAYREAGYLMLLPSLMSRVIKAFDRIFQQRGLANDSYVVPVSVARRMPGSIWENLFFNHISFLFFQIPVESATTATEGQLAVFIREQLYEQMKNQWAEDLYHAAMLTRIAPLSVMRVLATIPMQGKTGSFYFSCLKESVFKENQFLGVEVENLLHTPHIPVPPGIGVTINLFRQRLNLTLSCAEGFLLDSEIEVVLADLSRLPV